MSREVYEICSPIRDKKVILVMNKLLPYRSRQNIAYIQWDCDAAWQIICVCLKLPNTCCLQKKRQWNRQRWHVTDITFVDCQFSVYVWEKEPTLFPINFLVGNFTFLLIIEFVTTRLKPEKIMNIKRWSSIFSSIVPLLLLLLLVLQPARGASDAISDDDLIERIKSNEYVVALFGK